MSKVALDYRVAMLEDQERWYIQLEVKIPKAVPADLRHEHLARLATQFAEAIQL